MDPCLVDPNFESDQNHYCELPNGHSRTDEVTIHECACGVKWYEDGSEVW